MLVFCCCCCNYTREANSPGFGNAVTDLCPVQQPNQTNENSHVKNEGGDAIQRISQSENHHRLVSCCYYCYYCYYYCITNLVKATELVYKVLVYVRGGHTPRDIKTCQPVGGEGEGQGEDIHGTEQQQQPVQTAVEVDVVYT